MYLFMSWLCCGKDGFAGGRLFTFRTAEILLKNCAKSGEGTGIVANFTIRESGAIVSRES
jgi:hypothetical protein